MYTEYVYVVSLSLSLSSLSISPLHFLYLSTLQMQYVPNTQRLLWPQLYARTLYLCLSLNYIDTIKIQRTVIDSKRNRAAISSLYIFFNPPSSTKKKERLLVGNCWGKSSSTGIILFDQHTQLFGRYIALLYHT